MSDEVIAGFGAINMVALKPQAAVLVYAIPVGAFVIAAAAAALRMRPRRQSKVQARLAQTLDAAGARLGGLFRPRSPRSKTKPVGAT